MKIFFHVGLGKTATSFLQKNIFPKSSFCYLGKKSNNWCYPLADEDPWNYIKQLQNYRPGVCAADLKKLLSRRGIALDDHFSKIFSENENILVSDEGFTMQPIMGHVRVLYPYMQDCSNSSSLSWRNFFEEGISLADSIWNSKVPHFTKLKTELLYCKGSDSLPFKLNRIMEMFDLSLGRVLLVDRDIGSWMVSFFLQVAFNCENKGLKKMKFDLPLLFVWSGFAARWERYLHDAGRLGYLHGHSFASSVKRSFGAHNLDIVQYNQNPSVFAERLINVLPSFGVNSANAVIMESLQSINVTSKKTIASAEWSRVPSLREECSERINEYIDSLLLK